MSLDSSPVLVIDEFEGEGMRSEGDCGAEGEQMLGGKSEQQVLGGEGEQQVLGGEGEGAESSPAQADGHGQGALPGAGGGERPVLLGEVVGGGHDGGQVHQAEPHSSEHTADRTGDGGDTAAWLRKHPNLS